MVELVADLAWGWRMDSVLADMAGPESERLRERPGEVVLVLERPDDGIWLHTKGFYPPGTWRLPTGGLKHGEAPDVGYVRELAEETGIVPAPPPRRLAVVRYAATTGERYAFASYLYRVPGVGEPPRAADASEDITGWRAVPPAELDRVAADLRRLPDGWRPWGEFRAVAHEVLAAIRRRDLPSQEGDT